MCVRAQAPVEPAKIKRKEIFEYGCAACGVMAHSCCARCYANQALAVERAPPFDSSEYRAQEVLCPQCDEIMKTAATACTMDSDGRFACSSGATCHVPLTRSYED